MISKKTSSRIERMQLCAFVCGFCFLLTFNSRVEAGDRYYVVGGASDQSYFVPVAGAAGLFPSDHQALLKITDLAGVEDPTPPGTLNPTSGTAKNGRLPHAPPDASSYVTFTPTANRDNAGESKIRLCFTRDKIYATKQPSEWVVIPKRITLRVESLTPNKGMEVDDFDDDADTKVFVIQKGSGLITVTAVPFPLATEENLPPGWTLTGGSGVGKLTRTIDMSVKGDHYLTCTAGSTSKELRIMVVELSIVFKPDDSFFGRSFGRLGIGELGELRVESSPPLPSALNSPPPTIEGSWSLTQSSSGDALIQGANNAIPILRGGTINDFMSVKVFITYPPFLGTELTKVLEQNRPTATRYVQRGTDKGHLQGAASAAFLGDYYMEPKDISFKACLFREDPVAPAGAWGIYKKTGPHKPGPPVAMGSGNIQTGCPILGFDTVRTSRNPPFAAGGGFWWHIPTRVNVAAAPGKGAVVDAKSHSVATTPAGTCTLTKDTVSVTIPANAATEHPEWFIP